MPYREKGIKEALKNALAAIKRKANILYMRIYNIMRQTTKQKKRKILLSDKKKTRRRRQQQKGGFPFGIVPVVVQDKDNNFVDFQVESNTIDRGLYAKKHHYFPLMRRAKTPNDFDFRNVYDKTYNFFHREPKNFRIKTVKIAANTDEDIQKIKVLNKVVRYLRKKQQQQGMRGGSNGSSELVLTEKERELLQEMGLDELAVQERLEKKEEENVDPVETQKVESERQEDLKKTLRGLKMIYGELPDDGNSLVFDPSDFSSLQISSPNALSSPVSPENFQDKIKTYQEQRNFAKFLKENEDNNTLESLQKFAKLKKTKEGEIQCEKVNFIFELDEKSKKLNSSSNDDIASVIALFQESRSKVDFNKLENYLYDYLGDPDSKNDILNDNASLPGFDKLEECIRLAENEMIEKLQVTNVEVEERNRVINDLKIELVNAKEVEKRKTELEAELSALTTTSGTASAADKQKIADLESDLNGVKATIAAAPDTTLLQNEIDKLNAENVALTTRIVASTSAASTPDTASLQRISELEEQIRKLKSVSPASSNSEIDRLKAEVKRLKDENAKIPIVPNSENMNVLLKQLEDANIKPLTYIPLNKIREEISDLMKGTDYADETHPSNKRFEYLLACRDVNPDYIKELEKEKQEFITFILPQLKEWHKQLEDLIPDDINKLSMANLKTKYPNIHEDLLKRFTKKEALWLIIKTKIFNKATDGTPEYQDNNVLKYADADFKGRYSTEKQGYDIRELAAIYIALPNFPTGYKLKFEYKENLLKTIKDTLKDKKGTINPLYPDEVERNKELGATATKVIKDKFKEGEQLYYNNINESIENLPVIVINPIGLKVIRKYSIQRIDDPSKTYNRVPEEQLSADEITHGSSPQTVIPTQPVIPTPPVSSMPRNKLGNALSLISNLLLPRQPGQSAKTASTATNPNAGATNMAGASSISKRIGNSINGTSNTAPKKMEAVTQTFFPGNRVKCTNKRKNLIDVIVTILDFSLLGYSAQDDNGIIYRGLEAKNFTPIA